MTSRGQAVNGTVIPAGCRIDPRDDKVARFVTIWTLASEDTNRSNISIAGLERDAKVGHGVLRVCGLHLNLPDYHD